jgi:hypothetical protein
MRARMALWAAGITAELREVKLAAKPPALIAASPKATVPVLVLSDGTVIDQSLDIMRWALAQNDPEGWLAGDDAGLIAANDGQPVRRKAAQPGPFMFDALNIPIDHGLQTVNGGRDVQFLRRSVAGRGCGFVMRAEP